MRVKCHAQEHNIVNRSSTSLHVNTVLTKIPHVPFYFILKWCIKGDCVDNGSPMTNGGWSEWSDYTACTRSCEGGVRYRERTCTNPP